MSSSPFTSHLKSPHELVDFGQESGASWAHLRVGSSGALAQLVRECSTSGIKVLIGKPREQAKKRPKPDGSYAFIDLEQLNKVIEHRRGDQVISVETGMQLAQLDAMLEPQGQCWPVSIARSCTIYDVIASGDGGCLEHGFGGPRNLILGLEALLPTGESIKTGGKVVKNVTGYDMTKLFVGARGTLVIPYLAHLRLFARPQSSASLLGVARTGNADFLGIAQSLMSSGLPLAALEIFSRSFLSTSDAAATASFKKLLPDRNWDSNQLVMFLQVREHEEVIAEILPQLIALTAPNLVLTQVAATTGLAMVQQLSELPDQYYELSCAPSMMATLLSDVEGLQQHRALQMRPGSGRLRLSGEVSPALKDKVTAFARRRASAIYAAYAQGDCYNVERYPDEDAAANEIEKA